MPDAVCIKAGGIDDKAVRDFKKTAVEFYCKDRMAYSKAVEGAEQKPVSNPLVRESFALEGDLSAHGGDGG